MSYLCLRKMEKHCYIAIDLKSFYASVECVERGLDPLDACLVVADASRTDKTICLAVSPALKSFGIGGRPRLFEVVQKVREVNRSRGRAGTSTSGRELSARRDFAVDYIIAPPRMAHYIAYSQRIYNIYLQFAAPEDIHVYSIDEVFIDATPYLRRNGLSPHDMAMEMIRAVLRETGVTATAGIGTNLYLCKIAMDIVAKKMAPDKDGVRIAALDEKSYRRQLWDHRPLTDFWRVGRGIAARLAPYGVETMGDIARMSIDYEDTLYQLFGVNAELLIDHAWGREPVEMAHIKAARPATKSVGSGQVLTAPYSMAKARVVVLEMADALALDLVDKGLVAKKIVLEVGYDVESLTRPEIASRYDGRVTTDHYGRAVPFHAHGTATLPTFSSSSADFLAAAAEIFDRTVNPILLIRRLTITAAEVIAERDIPVEPPAPRQLDLFTDYEAEARRRAAEAEAHARERRRQEAILRIKKTFGKNAILRGINYAEGATQRDRNSQIGGHHE